MKYGWSPHGKGNGLRKRPRTGSETYDREKEGTMVKDTKRRLKERRKIKDYDIPQSYGKEYFEGKFWKIEPNFSKIL